MNAEELRELRELLELAAKAAGLPPEGMEGGEGGLTSKGGLVWSGNGLCIDWNPLTDDGDSRRLEVALGISVTPYPIYGPDKHSVIAKQYRSAGLREPNQTEVIELYGDDPCAATRLAVLRCAAEIGRELP